MAMNMAGSRAADAAASRGDGGDQRYADGGRNAGVADHLHGVAPLLTVGVPLDLRRPRAKSLSRTRPAAAFSRVRKGVYQRHRSGHERADTEIKGDHGRPRRMEERIFMRRTRRRIYGTVARSWGSCRRGVQAAGAGHRGWSRGPRGERRQDTSASVALHVLCIGWGLGRSHPRRRIDAGRSLPVDIFRRISSPRSWPA